MLTAPFLYKDFGTHKILELDYEAQSLRMYHETLFSIKISRVYPQGK